MLSVHPVRGIHKFIFQFSRNITLRCRALDNVCLGKRSFCVHRRVFPGPTHTQIEGGRKCFLVSWGVYGGVEGQDGNTVIIIIVIDERVLHGTHLQSRSGTGDDAHAHRL